MYKALWAALVSCFWLFSLQAQENCSLRIYGAVVDEHDGSKLAYANLQLRNSENQLFGTSSALDGSYEIGGLCPGSYQLIVSHIGCEPDTLSFDLKRDKRVDPVLEHHLEELQEIEVLGESKAYSSETLGEQEAKRRMGENMAEMITAVPGVTTFKTGANISKPMIGGFTSNRVQILNHGVQHQNQNWGDEHAPEIDPFAYVDYEVIKGAGALKYGGGAIGGIVRMKPKPMPFTNGVHGRLSGLYASNNRMYSPSLLLEGKFAFLPKLAWRTQASQRKAGNLRSPDYYQDNTGFEDENFAWTLAWTDENWRGEVYYSLNRSTIGIFSGAHIGNLTDLRNIINSGVPREVDTEGFSYDIERPYQLVTHELIRGQLNRYFENGKMELRFSRQFNIREEFDKELPRNAALAALDLPEFSLSLESYLLNLDYEGSKGNYIWEVGGGYLMKENTVNSFIDFIPNYLSNESNLYGLLRWNEGAWGAELAARLDHTDLEVSKFVQGEFAESDHNFMAYSANMGLKREVGDHWRLGLNLNYAERAPAINELYSDGLHHGTATLEYGDPDIEKEKASTIRLAVNYKKERFTADLESYLQWIDDFIYLEPAGIDLSTRGAFPIFRWVNTYAFMRGIDLSMAYQLHEKWKLWQKGSMLLAEQGDDFLVNIPANRIEHGLEYQEEKLGLNVYASYLYVDRQRRFDAAVEIAEPPAAYRLLNAGLNKDFRLSNRVSSSLGLRVNNLLNITYRDYLNRFRYYSDEMGRDVRLTIELNF